VSKSAAHAVKGVEDPDMSIITPSNTHTLAPRRDLGREPRFQTAAHTFGTVQLHASHARYIDHVERHFTTPEAIEALRFAQPTLAGDPNFASDRALIRALRCEVGARRSIEIREAYMQLAKSTLDEAHSLGWTISPSRGIVIAFATTGLLAVIDRGILRTLFFPALESADTRADRMRLSQSEIAAEAQRARSWSDAERHYYRVFRPALQLIRSMPDDGYVGACSQYGALKRVMPAASALRLEGWLGLRSVTGADGCDHERSAR
jgi:hypothetical protein